MSGPLARTPLYARHAEAGAKLVPFAGFEMPVHYGSIVEEHRAVRERAGLFDVSHMGELRLSGRDAGALAQLLFTNDVATLRDGRVRYGALLDREGGILDDVTLYRVDERDYLFCVNASNIAADLAWMREVRATSGLDCEVRDQSEETALLALQGPQALAIAASLRAADAAPPKRWRFAQARIADIDAWLSRTGYTGEDGYEIYVAAADAVALWDRLVEAGGRQLCPAGLGARDTLRLEMGYPLYGHELERSRNPLEAGMDRFVALEREFVGRQAVLATRDAGVRRRLVGLVLEGRQVARQGFPVATPTGPGVVTSGSYGPSVERSIAMGYVPADSARAGSRAHVEVRGKLVPCEVVETPFYNRKRG